MKDTENRETGERPVRSRHCIQEDIANMSLRNREGSNIRKTVSQETCQLWYGNSGFQVTRFDCTENIFDNPTAFCVGFCFFVSLFV